MTDQNHNEADEANRLALWRAAWHKLIDTMPTAELLSAMYDDLNYSESITLFIPGGTLFTGRHKAASEREAFESLTDSGREALASLFSPGVSPSEILAVDDAFVKAAAAMPPIQEVSSEDSE